MAVTPKPRKRADGAVRWRVQFRLRPGATPTAEHFDTYDDAQQFIDLAADVGWEAAQRVRDGMSARDERVPTLRTWFETHLDIKAASVTPGTIDEYRREAERTWMPRLGRLPLDMITPEAVTSWIAWQRQQETHRSATRRANAVTAGETPPAAELVRPKTISNAQRLLSSVLSTAAERYPITNPAKGAKIPKDAESAEMVFLTREEYAALYQHIPAHFKPLVAFLAGSGARWGEMTALRRTDFDLDATVPSVRIPRAWKKGAKGGVYLGSTKSKRGTRTVSLSPSTVTAIRDVVQATPASELVFRGIRGARVRHQNFHPRIWHPSIAASGIGKKPRVHDLRHTHASWLIAQGVPLPIIQQRLGHESIRTTVDTYGHLLPEAAVIAASAVEEAMGQFDTDAVEVAELMPPTD